MRHLILAPLLAAMLTHAWAKTPTAAAARTAATRPVNVDDFIEQSVEGLKEMTRLHTADWKIGDTQRFDVDMDAGRITWTFADGAVATAPIQMVGTFNPKDTTFLWAWDHPSIPQPLRKDAALVKAYGEKHKVARLTARKIECDAEASWEFAALAARLGGAHGAYSGEANGPRAFVTFGQVTVESPRQQGKRVIPRPIVFPEHFGAPANEADAKRCLDIVRAYRKTLFETDQRYHEVERAGLPAGERLRDMLEKLVGANMAAHEKYWRATDDYHEPGALGWPSHYDDAKASAWAVLTPEPGRFFVRFRYDSQGLVWTNAYELREFPDTRDLRIVNYLFNLE